MDQLLTNTFSRPLKEKMTKLSQRNALVDLFAIVFGIGAWVAINGLWVELPLLVQELPEGWSLPSYLSVVIQLANVGPITYSLLRMWKPSLNSVPIIYMILSLGCLSSALLSLFWDETTVVGDVERSTALLTLVFFLALVDCTSSVLYIPYMAVWKDIYLPSYLIGEGLSGFIPALVALGQGVGGNAECENITVANNVTGNVSLVTSPKELEPNFSVEVFFYILFGMMVASALSFLMLERLPSIQRQRSPESNSHMILASKILKEDTVANKDSIQKASMSQKIFIFLLAIQSWASMLSNGFLPSIQSYSCGPYGNVAYHLAATLSALANPLAALCTMLLSRAHPKVVGALAVLGTVFASYVISTAVMSPSPPLQGLVSGSALIVIMWIAFVGVITYVRVEIANLMREEGATHLFWSGVVTQAGSAVGATVAFVLVNKTSIFQTYNPCA